MIILAVMTPAAFPETFLYRLHDAGSLGGPSSRPAAVNDRGWMVGGSDTADGRLHAFLWTPEDGMRDLGTLGGERSLAHAISEDGTVVGESASADRPIAAFRWTSARGMHPLPDQGADFSIAYAINDRGQAVGTVEDAEGAQAVMWENDRMQVLPRLPGEGYIQPLDVNDAGDIVGQIQTVAGNPGDAASHAFHFGNALTASSLVTFRLLAPQIGSAAVALNRRGVSAGYVLQSGNGVRAARFPPESQPESLDDGGAIFSSVAGINDRGDMAGSFIPAYSSDESAGVWIKGRLFDLNDVTDKPEGWHLVQAVDINNRGQVVGYAIAGDADHAFILDPVAGSRPETWPRAALLLDDHTGEADTERYVVLRAEPVSSEPVAIVDFFRDGVLLGTVHEAPFEWGWQGAMDDTPVFHVRVTDAAGRTVSSPRKPLDAPPGDPASRSDE